MLSAGGPATATSAAAGERFRKRKAIERQCASLALQHASTARSGRVYVRLNPPAAACAPSAPALLCRNERIEAAMCASGLAPEAR
jgi:hypothetical protein